MSRTVRVATEIPVPAREGFDLAHRLEVFDHVVWPVIRIGLSDDLRARAGDPNAFGQGDTMSGRLRILLIFPAWRHELTIVEDGETAEGAFEIYTNEHGGPMRVWNHRLTFEPTGELSCRYTDEVELDGPRLLLPGNVAFARLFFRYRQWRWRRMLARRG